MEISRLSRYPMKKRIFLYITELKMNEHHESLLRLLNDIEAKGLTRSEALQMLLAGELSRLNDSMDYLKRAAGNLDDTLTRMGN